MQGHCERCVWGCILVQASGRSWLPRTVLHPRWDLEVPIRSSPVLCRGTAWGCCPSPHGRGLRAGRPVCQERGAGCTCVRQAVRQGVQGSRQACAGAEGHSCSCCRGDQETTLVLASATPMALLL